MKEDLFSPHFLSMQIQLETLNFMAVIINSHMEMIRSIETAKRQRETAEEQWIFQKELYLKSCQVKSAPETP